MTGTAEQAARLLARLAEEGATIPDLPEAIRPATAAAAYAVQDAALEGAMPYGWKVGPADVPGSLCAAPLRGVAPYSSPHTLSGPGASTMAIEVEVAVTLGADLPGGASAEEVGRSIAGVHLAYELFSSRYADRAKVAFPSLLADHLSNAGIVVGTGQAFDPDLRLDTLEIELLSDGEPAGNSASGPTLATVLEQLAWLADHASGRGFPLRRGTVVLTGARIGPLPVAPGGALQANAAIGGVMLAG
jgi:2-keto-4-pentenoate hydratase